MAHQLDYASPRTTRGTSPLFRIGLGCCAVFGVAANLFFIGVSLEQLHSAQWAYHDLMQNPRAYGREIDPTTIASLRNPYQLWMSFGAFGLASGLGLLLAVHLLTGAWLLDRDYNLGVERLSRYRRWKPLGICLTAITFLWASQANQSFWIAATRHIPVGSGPPIVPAALLVVCALIPWWWIGHPMSCAGAGDACV